MTLYSQEKGYRDFGHDMDNTDSLLECGLGFTCDFIKKNGFIGMEAVGIQEKNRKQNGGLKKRLASILCLDPSVMLHHGEVLWRNGKRNTDVRTASYGHTIGGAVGLAMIEDSKEPITKQYIEEGKWEVQVGNLFYPCKVSLKPLYDPKNLRIKR